MGNLLITSRFGGLHKLPGDMVTPLGSVWQLDQVRLHVIQREIALSEDLKVIADKIKRVKQPESDSQVYHFRAVQFTKDSLVVEVGLSWYRYTLLHTAFEPEMRRLHPEFAEDLLKHIQLKKLHHAVEVGGPLSSGVGITTVVVTSDGFTVIVHRSKERVSVNADLDHPGLAEGVNFDEGEVGEIDIGAVAVRSAVEELKLLISKQNLLFLGLCIDGRYLWPGIIARVQVPYTFEEVKRCSEEAEYRWEREEGVRAVSYTPEGIAEELRHADNPPGQGGMTGFGAWALVAAGVADFGKEAMERACR